MSASSARRASAALLSQVACQRSGTVVAANPDAQFAAKIPSLKPWLGPRERGTKLAHERAEQVPGREVLAAGRVCPLWRMAGAAL